MKKEYNFLLGIVLIIGILFAGFVLAVAPTWQGSDINYSISEDIHYYHDLRNNISGFNDDVTFDIDTENNISWTNADGLNSVTADYISEWISILNSVSGNLSINATSDNQTGFFVIPIQATNTTDSEASVTNFEFIVNATNDFPNFTNIDVEYNLTQNIDFTDYLNASDEEKHYPLNFNISFFNNCTLANWSTRGESNCSLFAANYFSNTSALMNFTPIRNDVGIYWANISVMDNGENYTCPHIYCDNITYQQNKTIYYSQVVVFNVFSILELNISDCQNKIFQENESGTCFINITTKDQADSLNVSSKGFLRNYDTSVVNASWFYSTTQTNAENFSKTIVINYTPQKTEIGNWTINFSVQDLTSGEEVTEEIYVYVNRTINDIPELASIENQNTSIDLLTRINISTYDDDLMIPDKNNLFGGYNETSSFTAVVLNQSNLSQELSLNGFDVEILNMPVSGTNRTEAKIEFTPNQTEVGNYTINISVTDAENAIDSLIFNLSILNNAAPVWNATFYYFNLTVNSSYANTINFYLNLTDGYVSDSDLDDTIVFSNTSAMPSLSLTSAGIINFTPYKQDVGGWSFNITATDDLGLTNNSIFIFNISNTNTNPVIETPISVVNASVVSNSNITCSEDNIITITLWIEDDDIKITNKTAYNETFNVNVTIQGDNSNLFEFVITSAFPTSNFQNRTEYEAVFTPNKTDVGIYNITINVTDVSNASDVLEFNLTVEGVNDFPVLEDISNQTSASNRSFYYDFNASDEEDGNDTQGNLTFFYDFISGTDFINNNQTIFNTTSGILNMTFNDTQGGIYNINISVNDSENSVDSQLFSISVYSVPNINYPLSGYNFSLQENVTSNLTFTINHSVGDNLTYLFYINDVLRKTSDYYGNNTNFTWQFTPNFTDETHGDFANLTLVVYPLTSDLINKTEINTTINWNINITHANFPVSFSGYIGDKQASYGSPITINLSSYFVDVDYTDAYINQTVNFSVESDSFPSYIVASVSDWVLTLSSSIAVTEILNITGNDSFSEAISNSFEVEFTTPIVTTVTTPSTGGGGGGSTTEVYVSLKIIVPEPASVYQKDRIILPITLYNSGKKILSGITLSGSVEGDSAIINDVKLSFEETYISSLGIGEERVVNLIMDVNTDKIGAFEVTLNASVENPDYEDWGKIYFTIKEGSGVLGKLLFAEEFMVDNPECAELTEMVKEARDLFNKGDFINTVLKINQVIDACKRAISQPNMMRERENLEDKFYRYLFIITIIVLLIGFIYYSYRRMRLKRGFFDKNVIKKQLNQEKIKLVFFVLSASLIGLFFTSKMEMTGNLVNDDNLNSVFKIWFFIILIFIFLILFLYKKRSLWKKIFVSIKKIYLILKLKNHKNKIYKLIKNKINFCSKKSHNALNDLIGRKVYADSGDYVGEVQDVYLRKNKINSLKIKLQCKSKMVFLNEFKNLFVKFKKLKVKGIFVNYNQVKDIGNIVIIEEKVLKFLKNKGEFVVKRNI